MDRFERRPPTTTEASVPPPPDRVWLHDSSQQAVYVTVDTGQPASSSGGNYEMDYNNPAAKLDALAIAASVQTPLRSGGRSGSSPLVCGECSESYHSSNAFFEHWLRRHCRPHSSEDEVGLPPLRHCERCNHVFVYGMQRFREHSLTCGGAQQQQNVIGVKRTAASAGFMEETTMSRPPTKTVVRSAVVPTPAAAAPTSAPSGGGGGGGIPSSGSVVSCGVCSITIRTITSFFLHWLDTHDQIIEILEEVWQCGQCSPNRLFPTRDGLMDHVECAHPFSARTVLECNHEACRSSSSSSPHVSSKFVSQFQLEEHQRLHDAVTECPKCRVEATDVVQHYRVNHEVTCRLCQCQVLADEEEKHLSQKHCFEMVWSRNRSLEKINSVSLASKQIQESDSKSAAAAAADTAKKKAKKKAAASATATATTTTTESAAVPLQEQPTDMTTTTTTSSSLTCNSCGMFFTSEKLLEKHYFANHEFQCKFCAKTMDKDEYGDHLRMHLASERKKTVGTTATATTSNVSDKARKT